MLNKYEVRGSKIELTVMVLFHATILSLLFRREHY